MRANKLKLILDRVLLHKIMMQVLNLQIALDWVAVPLEKKQVCSLGVLLDPQLALE